MRLETEVNLTKFTYSKIRYSSEEVKNIFVSRLILPKNVPKTLKLTLIIGEPLNDGAYEVTLTALSQNYAVFNSPHITGLYINKKVFTGEVPQTIGVKLEAT